jgi:hypothetical protein
MQFMLTVFGNPSISDDDGAFWGCASRGCSPGVAGVMLGPWLQGSERFRALTLWTNVTHFLQDDLST